MAKIYYNNLANMVIDVRKLKYSGKDENQTIDPKTAKKLCIKTKKPEKTRSEHLTYNPGCGRMVIHTMGTWRLKHSPPLVRSL